MALKSQLQEKEDGKQPDKRTRRQEEEALEHVTCTPAKAGCRMRLAPDRRRRLERLNACDSGIRYGLRNAPCKTGPACCPCPAFFTPAVSSTPRFLRFTSACSLLISSSFFFFPDLLPPRDSSLRRSHSEWHVRGGCSRASSIGHGRTQCDAASC